MRIEAVKQNPWSIYFVENQTEEISMAAVRKNCFTLKYIHCQTEEIILEAIKQDDKSLEHAHNSVLAKVEARYKNNQ